MGIFFEVSETAVKFCQFLRRQIRLNPAKFIAEFLPDLFDNAAFFLGWQTAHLFNNFRPAHAINLLQFALQSSRKWPVHSFRTPQFTVHIRMIPREILKKIRQIEIRTNRLVSETLAGQYHSVFKGQGMNFEEVREYQPGDEVRSIDWNVTARMNHPFVKKFVEERELTLMLVVDVSGSGLFGSGEQSKRELAAEIASVLAFSAIRNNDKVGLILFTEEVEKFIPPRKGRRHVLRVIREILFFTPKRRGTNLNLALEFLSRTTPHRAIAVVVSDFLGQNIASRQPAAGSRRQATGAVLPQSLALASFAALRQANRRHDVVAIQITDRFELGLPALGRLVLKDAETGEVVEVNTGDRRKRAAFEERQARAQSELLRVFRSAKIDSIQLRTDRPYTSELGRFFETREKRRMHG